MSLIIKNNDNNSNNIIYLISIINGLVVFFHGFYFYHLRDIYLPKDTQIMNVIDCSTLICMFTWIFELTSVISGCETVFPYLVFNIIFGTIHYTLIIKSYIYIKKHKD